MPTLLRVFVFLAVAVTSAGFAPPQTWFVRPDGGTRYEATNQPGGQCDGLADVAYPGSGTNQHCAFNDVRWLWDVQNYQPMRWVIAGGDTVVLRGCHALPTQQKPDNPHCRLGSDAGTGSSSGWCYAIGNYDCHNPPIPPGTAANHTRILGQCAYDSPYTCTPIDNNYPYGPTNETQLFSGWGLNGAVNLFSTNYVDIEGIELTTHNGICTIGVGSPADPRGCSSSDPMDDYGQNGFVTNNATSNIHFQDVYIHGMGAAGLGGPIGGPITLTRVFAGFNAFAGWNFDDGHGTPDAPGSTFTAHYMTMIFNGCYEEYPITHPLPARVCYDTNSAGFGDSLSGQGVGESSDLQTFTCDHCVNNYNTKDGFIGPHINIHTLTITNSVAIGNMGADWKWGGDDKVQNLTNFRNNLTVSDCTRMKHPMTGVPSTYNKYLTGFCRAGGNGLASVLPANSVWNMQNNTFITAQQIAWLVGCATAPCSGTGTINSTNNIFLGYVNPSNPYGAGNVPTLYYFEGGGAITLNTANNDEWGMKLGDCTTRESRRGAGKGHASRGKSQGILCVDPRLTNQPAPGWTDDSALDVFNPFLPDNAFYPTKTSPVNLAGLVYPGLPPTDYYNVQQTAPPVIGAVVTAGGVTPPIPPIIPPSGCFITINLPAVTRRDATPVWTTIGAEGDTVTVPVNTLVRYGNEPESKWSVTFLSPVPPFIVNNWLVGDPAPNFAKVLQSTPTPSTAPPNTLCVPVPSTAALTLDGDGHLVITVSTPARR